MNTPFSPVANRHNPKAAYTKIYKWVLRFGSPTLLSSSCENPILLNYQSLAQSNCWVPPTHYTAPLPGLSVNEWAVR